MTTVLSHLTFHRSLLALLGCGCVFVGVQAGCAPLGDEPRLATQTAALDQADCSEYGGTWNQGGCTLPGGSTTVDVPIPPDDEPIEPWTGPGEDPEQPPCDTCGGGDPGPGPGPEPVICSLYDTTFARESTGSSTSRAEAIQRATWSAETAARNACFFSVGPICTTATAGDGVVSGVTCTLANPPGKGSGLMVCRLTVTTPCSYSF